MSAAEVDEACIALRTVLAQTRGLDRREFTAALSGR